ncbi:Cys-tRNA(Pro) deacylase [Treponema rectale]|uniref:Cys-tRNA(Pro)/Cys-tRNA(Cys) deacylase n=1 Tax=Treponema rectale TaxID=744512 RepID=A0A7M1XIU1_9SPIR|nr:Cys-tRNA(Pro) deacylase [Treponema rectale]
MAKTKTEKTNAMRLLDTSNISYIEHEYDPEKALSAKEVANIMNQDVEQVFKTLVTVGKSKEHYVFVVPGEGELDLKKAAKVSGEKFIEMIPQKDLLPLTGYIHGGCSPLGMKKKFKTFIDETAQLFDTIFVSGGKRGLQIEVNPLKLAEVVEATFADIQG